MAAKKSARSKRASLSEVFSITAGHLGPLGTCDVAIRPLTVLVGRQGTGKSLLAQMLYFFRGLPQLVQFDVASRRLKENESAPEKIVRRIVDGMRSSHRSFARLTVPSVAIRWRGNLAATGVHAKQRDFRLNIQSATSQVLPGKALRELVEELRDERSDPPFASAFIPTERLLYAMQLGPNSLRVMSAPLLLETFAQTMEIAGRIQADWDDGKPDTAQGRWVREHLLEPLAGEARLRGNAWRWSFADSGGVRRQIDFDMASSGQRANWPLSVIPQVLFTLRARGELAQDFTLYVEEPEIHLHPAAERAVVEVLAYLVKRGIRIVVTTHSLTVLYTINNLLKASKLPPGVMSDEIDPGIRLRSDDVAAYHLRSDGGVTDIVDDEGVIDERALAEVADDLSLQLARIVKKAGPPQ